MPPRRRRTSPFAGAGAAMLALALLPVGACAQDRTDAGTVGAVSRDSLFERASRSRAKGSREAPVTVYELSDFQCPFCARFTADVQPHIERDYIDTGKVLWVFVNYPLPMHEHAWLAAEAATCAGGTGGDFWAVHDQLFEQQRAWAEAEDPGAVLRRLALAAGAPEGPYDACVAEDQVATILTQDLISAAGTGASGTPAFVVAQAELVVGLKSYEEWREILDRHIAAAQGQQPDSVPGDTAR
ncbi:MAG TPA: thioredoxin domain-containing protein [Longimicrobiales bacterium]|nr:thioredoxin domain-containing protein [Longimicrobiales bacterium]